MMAKHQIDRFFSPLPRWGEREKYRGCIIYSLSPNGGEGQGEGEVIITEQKKYVTAFMNYCTKAA